MATSPWVQSVYIVLVLSMKSHILQSILTLAASCLVACWSAPRGLIKTAPQDPGTRIEGLSDCRTSDDSPVLLDRSKPLVLLVHGCNFSTGGFKSLAQVFEAHDQQTICFNYNDRDAIDDSAAQMRKALAELEHVLGIQEITILGHSQGGLVARRAMTGKHLSESQSYRLVTVSSPFSGIDASSHCGLTWLHIVTLGITAGVCQAITGSKWTEIYPGSDFMTRPGVLSSSVESHIKLNTDERGSCRVRGPDGRCRESDFVFTISEQAGKTVIDDSRVLDLEVKAGHVEIVGESGVPPMKLIQALQRLEVLSQTPESRRTRIAELLKRLYR